MKNCYQVHASDNVATMLQDASNESVEVIGGSGSNVVATKGSVPLGHKVALTAIEPGARVVKYGVTIGIANQSILRGQWVHLHNCRSQVDERSSTLDIETGATKDTAYE